MESTIPCAGVLDWIKRRSLAAHQPSINRASSNVCTVCLQMHCGQLPQPWLMWLLYHDELTLALWGEQILRSKSLSSLGQALCSGNVQKQWTQYPCGLNFFAVQHIPEGSVCFLAIRLPLVKTHRNSVGCNRSHKAGMGIFFNCLILNTSNQVQLGLWHCTNPTNHSSGQFCKLLVDFTLFFFVK